MEVSQDVIVKKKSKRFYIKQIRAVHHRLIRQRYVDDGTEEPPERNDITDIFRERYCSRCGRKLCGKQVKYCLRCKGEKK